MKGQGSLNANASKSRRVGNVRKKTNKLKEKFSNQNWNDDISVVSASTAGTSLSGRSVDLVFTCLTKEAPILPLRQELNSLGFEVVRATKGTGKKAVLQDCIRRRGDINNNESEIARRNNSEPDDQNHKVNSKTSMVRETSLSYAQLNATFNAERRKKSSERKTRLEAIRNKRKQLRNDKVEPTAESKVNIAPSEPTQSGYLQEKEKSPLQKDSPSVEDHSKGSNGDNQRSVVSLKIEKNQRISPSARQTMKRVRNILRFRKQREAGSHGSNKIATSNQVIITNPSRLSQKIVPRGGSTCSFMSQSTDSSISTVSAMVRQNKRVIIATESFSDSSIDTPGSTKFKPQPTIQETSTIEDKNQPNKQEQVTKLASKSSIVEDLASNTVSNVGVYTDKSFSCDDRMTEITPDECGIVNVTSSSDGSIMTQEIINKMIHSILPEDSVDQQLLRVLNDYVNMSLNLRSGQEKSSFSHNENPKGDLLDYFVKIVAHIKRSDKEKQRQILDALAMKHRKAMNGPTINIHENTRKDHGNKMIPENLIIPHINRCYSSISDVTLDVRLLLDNISVSSSVNKSQREVPEHRAGLKSEQFFSKCDENRSTDSVTSDIEKIWNNWDNGSVQSVSTADLMDGFKAVIREEEKIKQDELGASMDRISNRIKEDNREGMDTRKINMPCVANPNVDSEVNEQIKESNTPKTEAKGEGQTHTKRISMINNVGLVSEKANTAQSTNSFQTITVQDNRLEVVEVNNDRVELTMVSNATSEKKHQVASITEVVSRDNSTKEEKYNIHDHITEFNTSRNAETKQLSSTETRNETEKDTVNTPKKSSLMEELINLQSELNKIAKRVSEIECEYVEENSSIEHSRVNGDGIPFLLQNSKHVCDSIRQRVSELKNCVMGESHDDHRDVEIINDLPLEHSSRISNRTLKPSSILKSRRDLYRAKTLSNNVSQFDKSKKSTLIKNTNLSSSPEELQTQPRYWKANVQKSNPRSSSNSEDNSKSVVTMDVDLYSKYANMEGTSAPSDVSSSSEFVDLEFSYSNVLTKSNSEKLHGESIFLPEEDPTLVETNLTNKGDYLETSSIRSTESEKLLQCVLKASSSSVSSKLGIKPLIKKAHTKYDHSGLISSTNRNQYNSDCSSNGINNEVINHSAAKENRDNESSSRSLSTDSSSCDSSHDRNAAVFRLDKKMNEKDNATALRPFFSTSGSSDSASARLGIDPMHKAKKTETVSKQVYPMLVHKFDELLSKTGIDNLREYGNNSWSSLDFLKSSSRDILKSSRSLQMIPEKATMIKKDNQSVETDSTEPTYTETSTEDPNPRDSHSAKV